MPGNREIKVRWLPGKGGLCGDIQAGVAIQEGKTHNKKTNTPEFMQFYAGRYFLVQMVVENEALVRCIDMENPDNVHEIVFDSSYGYNSKK